MHKPSAKKLLFLVGTLALTLAAFLAGGIVMSSAQAASTSSLNMSSQCDPKNSQCNTNETKALVVIAKVSGHTIQATMLAPTKGKKVTIITTSSTVYKPNRSIVAVGKTVAVAGTVNSNDSISAQVLALYDSSVTRIGGTLTAIKGSTLIIQARDSTHTVLLTSSTSFFKFNPQTKKMQPASRSDLKVGERIEAQGNLNKDGSLTAMVVLIEQAGTK